MRKTIIGALGILMTILITIGCTQNSRVRLLGASSTFNLPPGQKLISCSWKDDEDLWYLSRPFQKGENPVTLQYQQKSSWGTRNGILYIKESLADTAKVALVQNGISKKK